MHNLLQVDKVKRNNSYLLKPGCCLVKLFHNHRYFLFIFIDCLKLLLNEEMVLQILFLVFILILSDVSLNGWHKTLKFIKFSLIEEKVFKEITYKFLLLINFSTLCLFFFRFFPGPKISIFLSLIILLGVQSLLGFFEIKYNEFTKLSGLYNLVLNLDKEFIMLGYSLFLYLLSDSIF